VEGFKIKFYGLPSEMLKVDHRYWTIACPEETSGWKRDGGWRQLDDWSQMHI